MKHLMTLAALFVSSLAIAQIPTFPWNPDGNGDGVIGSSDLIELLTVYGQEFQNAIVSENQESASLIVGPMGHHRCQYYCENLPGAWKMPTEKDLVPVIDTLVQLYGQGQEPPASSFWIETKEVIVKDYEGSGFSNTNKMYPYMTFDFSYIFYGGPWASQVHFINQSTPYLEGYSPPAYSGVEEIPWCACTIKQLPRVDYSACADVINDPGCANQLVSDGWYPMGNVSDSGTQAFWRFAQ